MVWSFIGLVGALGVVVATQGDTRRYLLQGALVGSMLGVLFLVGRLLFMAPP